MGRLTIQEIAKVLITKNGLEQSEANRFATELFAVIQERLEKNDLVKVKGLGTFKVITVEARESVSVRTGSRVMIDEHSKITFTPDATMKELVNKPFSQFETVPLNDNVEFDDLKEQADDSEFEDIKDDLTDDELIQLEQMDQSEEPVSIRPVLTEPIKETEPKPEMKPKVEEELQELPQEEPQIEPKEEPKEEPQDDVEETSELVNFYDEEEESSPLSKWLWLGFAAICIACLSAFGGYYYGCQQTALKALGDTVVVRDTIYMAAPHDTISTEAPAQVDKQEVAKVEEPKQEAPKQEVPKAETPKVEKPKVETPKVEKPKAEPAPELDKYAQKDERVRLGAYRIVGLDHEVTVQQGQTFYSICRAHLGPDMECYIEVYNNLPRNPQIKAGQVIKIPKLQVKKRKKQ